jgi:two-component sensor histidine kinase
MAVISGLVSLESTRLKAADSVAILESLKARIDAISALYDRLYRSGNTEEVELGAYFRDLADTLWAGTAAAKKGVSLDLDLETVRLDARRAASLGIIANELLTDCLKYAFPDGRSGTVRLSLKRDGDRLLLEVTDDGVGLPAGFAVGSTAGLGLVLVEMLAAQVDGEFTAESARGARFLVRFPVSTGNPR